MYLESASVPLSFFSPSFVCLCLFTIFDYEQYLITIISDTEKLYSASTQAVVSPYGKEYTWEIKWPLMGRVGTELAKGIINALELPLSPSEYLVKVEEEYKKNFPQAQLLPGRPGSN